MRLCFEKSANQTPVPPTYVVDCLNTANKKAPELSLQGCQVSTDRDAIQK